MYKYFTINLIDWPPSTSKFLSIAEFQRIISEDCEYNLFKVWLHKTITEWQSQIIGSNLFQNDEDHIVLLFLYFFINYIAATGFDVNLYDFIEFTSKNNELLFEAFLSKGWFFLLLSPLEINYYGKMFKTISSTYLSTIN